MNFLLPAAWYHLKHITWSNWSSTETIMTTFSWHVNTYFGLLSSITSSKKGMQRYVFIHLCKNDRFVMKIGNLDISTMISWLLALKYSTTNWITSSHFGIGLILWFLGYVFHVLSYRIWLYVLRTIKRYKTFIKNMFFTGRYRANCSRCLDRQSDTWQVSNSSW